MIVRGIDMAQKLQLKPGQVAVCFDRPVGLAAVVPYPEGGSGPVDCVIGFRLEPGDVARLWPQMRGRLRPAGLLWFAFRKGFKPPDLTRDHGWQVVTAQGYDTVRAIALDGAWSALRFRHGSERQT